MIWTRSHEKGSLLLWFFEPEYLPGLHFPRLQIFKIEELLAGQQVSYPRMAPADTFKQAARKHKGPAPKDKQKSFLSE